MVEREEVMGGRWRVKAMTVVVDGWQAECGGRWMGWPIKRLLNGLARVQMRWRVGRAAGSNHRA